MSAKWPVLALQDCLDALIDYRGKTPDKTNSGVPLVTAKIIKGGRIETPSEFIAHDAYDAWMRRGMPQAGDVVLTTEAPLGEVAQLGHERVALAQRVVTLRGKNGLLDSTLPSVSPANRPHARTAEVARDRHNCLGHQAERASQSLRGASAH